MLNIFSCDYWPSAFLLWKNFYSVLISSGSWYFLDVELYELFIYVGYRLVMTLIGHIICKYFLLFSRLPFHLLMVSLAVQKLLSLIRSSLFIFVFISFTLGDRSKKKKIAVIYVRLQLFHVAFSFVWLSRLALITRV